MPTLMSLPTELRELIWHYAIVESETIPAYTLRRIVKRPLQNLEKQESPYWDKFGFLESASVSHLTSTVRQVKAHAEEPGLTRVSH